MLDVATFALPVDCVPDELISQNFLLSAKFIRSLNILSMLWCVWLASDDFRLFPLYFWNGVDAFASDADSATEFKCCDKLAEWNGTDDERFFTSADESSDGVSPENDEEKWKFLN